MSPLDQLKARAEQMRREGASMAEIARAVQRSVSTVHGWAAQGGWRIVELEAEGFAPPKGDRPLDSSGIPAPPGAALETTEGAGAGARMEWAQGCGVSGSDVTGETPPARDCAPSGHDAPPEPASTASWARGKTDAEPLSPLEAAKALHKRSAELGQVGQIRAAEAAARLAERILRTEAQLVRADAAHRKPDPERHEDGPGGAKAELERRFERFRKMHLEKLAEDPDWTPARTSASRAERFVFSLCHGEQVDADIRSYVDVLLAKAGTTSGDGDCVEGFEATFP